MSIRRAPRAEHFTVVPNTVICDDRLSFRARGLLAFILSKPDHWRCNSDQLASAAKEGREAVRTAMRELADVGYARLAQRRKDDGTFIKEWEVSDSTGAQESVVGSPSTKAQESDVGELGPLVSTEEKELIGDKPKRGSSLPPQSPTEAEKELARSKYPSLDVDAEVEKFRDHHLARGTVFKDWEAGWRTWTAKAAEWSRPRNGRSGTDDDGLTITGYMPGSGDPIYA